MSSSVTLVPEGVVPRNDQSQSPFTELVLDIGDRTWGDNRPLQREGSLRIGFWNCGGLPQTNSAPKNSMIRQWITMYDFDVVGLSECNVYWPHIPISQWLPERTLGWFETLHLSFAYLQAWKDIATAYQVGGVLLWSLNKMAHRVMEKGCDTRGLGRWCWTKYRGKNGIILRIISAYRCVLNKSGNNSAWSQQEEQLLLDGIETDPREQFVIDMVKALTQWVEAGELIILGLDLNEAVQTATFTTELLKLGIGEVISTKHTNTPATYDRGTDTIDGIYASASLMHSPCGYLPVLGDHRPSWIDIPFADIFGDTVVHQPRARRLQLSDPRVVNKYVEYLAEYVQHNQLLQQAQDLQSRCLSLPALEREYNRIDSLRAIGMEQAERQCRKLKMGAVPYSPEYQVLSRKVLVWKLVEKLKQGGRVNSRYFVRQLQKAKLARAWVQSLSLEEVQRYKRLAYSQLNQFTKVAVEHRQNWLEQLAEAWAQESGHNKESVFQSLLHREFQRREARIIKYASKGTHALGLSLVHVPMDGRIEEFSQKEQMENQLQAQLALRFHQAVDTPFAMEPLLSAIGPLGTGEGAMQILNGSYTCPPGVDEWTRKLIPHLAYTSSARNIRESFPLHLDSYKHACGWKKMKEKTACGFSKLSFAQFKAACKDPDVCSLDAILAELPYREGFSPQRWQHGIDVMLQKQPGNFLIDKLRAILLFESDFNQNNKRFGRQLMYYAEQAKSLASEQFGSRKGMSAIDQSLNKTLTFDLWRQLRIPGALCSNDAKSCYDRILHNVASLCLQRLGAPIPPIISMFSTLQKLQHHISTIHGVSSSAFLGKDWAVPIHGVGQGNGAGPQIWAAVSTPILNLLRSERCGTFLQSSISCQSLHFVGYAFVDDTDLVASHWENSSPQQVYHDMQHSLNAWHGGIRASGGAIVPEKSHWYLIDFEWKNGIPAYKSVATSPGRLTVADADNNVQTLTQLEPWVSSKTLGVHLAPDGNMDYQYEHMLKQATEWSDKIRVGHLSRPLASQALFTTIMKTLEYPLPSTTLSYTQCYQIMTPLFKYCLPRMGVVRTFPRHLAHSHPMYHGLNIPNLYWLQGFYHIDRLIRFCCSKHISGQLLQHSLEALRLEVGCNGSIFSLPYDMYGHLATPSWVVHTWKFLSEYFLTLDIYVPEIELQRENDSLLIPLFVAKGVQKESLYKINQCRIYLQVSRLSDIVSGCGTSLMWSAWKGERDETRCTRYNWPKRPNPPAEYWNHWFAALKLLCSSGRTLYFPLGEWIITPDTYFWYDASTERIYQEGNGIMYFYPRVAGRPSRNSIARFGNKQQCRHRPVSSLPALVAFHGTYLQLSGTCRVRPPQQDTPNNFFDFLHSKSPKSALWALQHLQYIGNYLAFCDSCSNNSVTLEAVSDGSFKNKHGTACWRISLPNSTGYLMGKVVVPGASSIQSAFRSELAGLYGIVITIWSVQKYFRCSVKVSIGCDGLSAIGCCQIDSDVISSTTSHFDLIYAIRYILRLTGGQVQWKHIKGHQDTDSTAILDKWATFNIQMDQEAKQYWQQTVNQPREFPSDRIFGEPGCLWIHNEKIVVDLKLRLLSYIGSLTTVPKWEQHFRWPKGIGSSIHWTMINIGRRTLPASRQLWLTKHVSGFFSSGKMMQLWKFKSHSQCPRCQFDAEDACHIIQCPHTGAIDIWDTSLRQLKSLLRNLDTPREVTTIICSKLNNWRNNVEEEPFTGDILPTFRHALQAQDILGWESFLQGFWSVQWEAAQAAYLTSIQSKVTILRWTKSILCLLWNISWDLWSHRNTYLHNAEVGELSNQLNDQIREQYYAGGAELLPKHRNLFSTPLELLIASPIPNRQMWIKRIKAARRQGQRSYGHERQLLRRWLSQT